eukprot:294226-Chlamydomonas_euryale.AAC.2
MDNTRRQHSLERAQIHLRELRAVSTACSCTVCNTKLRQGAAAQPGSCPRRASDAGSKIA